MPIKLSIIRRFLTARSLALPPSCSPPVNSHAPLCENSKCGPFFPFFQPRTFTISIPEPLPAVPRALSKKPCTPNLPPTKAPPPSRYPHPPFTHSKQHPVPRIRRRIKPQTETEFVTPKRPFVQPSTTVPIKLSPHPRTTCLQDNKISISLNLNHHNSPRQNPTSLCLPYCL